jgi:hypothetical protein
LASSKEYKVYENAHHHGIVTLIGEPVSLEASKRRLVGRLGCIYKGDKLVAEKVRL